MRIHTNLTITDLYTAKRNTGAPIGFEVLSEHKSRTHDRAFEVRLNGTGGRNNTGLYGAGDFDGATWDEWGAFLGSLYNLDPIARCGGSVRQPVYASAADYHHQTGNRFREGTLPADTHPRHNWQWNHDGFYCKHKSGCSATRPSWADAFALRAA